MNSPVVTLQVALVAAAVRTCRALEPLFPRVDGKMPVKQVLALEGSVAEAARVAVTVHCSVVVIHLRLAV